MSDAPQNPTPNPEPPPPPDTVAMARVSLADGAKTGMIYLLASSSVHFTPDPGMGDGGTLPLMITDGVLFVDLAAAWPTASFAILPTPAGAVELVVKATADAALIMARAVLPADAPQSPPPAPRPMVPPYLVAVVYRYSDGSEIVAPMVKS